MKATIERFGDKYKVTNSMGESAYLKQPIFAGESVKFSGPNGPVTRRVDEVEIIQMKDSLIIGSVFAMGRIDCTITAIDKFGNEPHYGFTWHDDAGVLHAGWMPRSFVQNFTGHY
jgi:hypothetical protein